MKNKIVLLLAMLNFIISFNISAQWQITTGPTQPNVVALCVNNTNLFAAATTAISLSSNNGTNWTPVINGLDGSSVYALAENGSTVFAGVGGGKVFQTSNNGTNWSSTSTGLPAYNIKSLTVNGSSIYAGTWGVYLTTNSGILWSKISNGWNANVNSVAINGSTILAGTISAGIYKSSDNGGTWNQINTGLPTQVNAVLIYGSTYLAGTSTGLYISNNSGATWTITNVTSSVNAFAVSGSNIFAGTGSGGVFLSTNSGTSWTAINTGLTNLNVLSLAISNDYIFAGTTGYVFRRLLSEVITTTEFSEISSNEISVFPNPFTSQISLTFNKEQNNTTLKIVDVLGNVIKSINIKGKEVTLDRGNMKEGIYFFKIVNSFDNTVSMKKVILK